MCCLNNLASSTLSSEATILATGGAGQSLSLHFQSRTATGDGVAWLIVLAARLGGLEFYQFIPPCLSQQINNF